MKEKLVAGLLVTALFTAAFGIALNITSVHAPAGGVVWIVPVNGTLSTVINTLAGNNDEIHILPGWVEPPFPSYTIWQNNLWIIGNPPALGAAPLIDLRGSTITVTGTGVFAWGLNIVDTGPTAAPIGILLAPPSGHCIIRSCTITGLTAGTIGIQVQSSDNDIDLNTMSTWGICIDLSGPTSTFNLVVGNTINPPYNWGIQVSGGAGFNQIYYNNLWVPGYIAELWDGNPGGSPPNAFDDTFFTLAGGPWGPSGGPSRSKGNFRATMPGPPIPPWTNGYMDMFPLAVPWVQIRGDINKDATVDIFDIVIVAASFATAWCQLGWDPRADLNGDGFVDIFDIVIVAANFGVIDP